MKVLDLIWQNVELFSTKLWYFHNKRDWNLWVFGEWFGERCGDNCFYFANYLASKHPEIQLVWIAHNGVDLSSLDEKIKRCVMDSVEAISFLKRAGVVFMVQSMDDIFHNFHYYHSGAIIVNFWHGIPWKKIHYDMSYNIGYKLYSRMRTKLYGGHVYLSTSDEFNKIIFSAFHKNHSNIICAGYPRNCIFYNSRFQTVAKSKLCKYLKQKGFFVNEDSKIVVYMPTFRDKIQNSFSFEDISDCKELNAVLEKHNAIIIQKSHFVSTHRELYKTKQNKRIILINEYISQELLAAADLLITDYSSCFFDYLLLNRPIIHFLYDYTYYANDDRGLYFPKEEVVGGDIVETTTELIASIDENLSKPDKCEQLRIQRRNRFLQYESPDACEIIFSDVMRRIEKRGSV